MEMKTHYIDGAMYIGCSEEHFTTYNPAMVSHWPVLNKQTRAIWKPLLNLQSAVLRFGLQ